MRVSSTGPKPARIALVGEAPGELEAACGLPFVGPSGQVLDDILAQVGIERADCFITNVIMDQPEKNNLATFCLAKADLPPGYDHPPIMNSPSQLYLHPDRLYELARLASELEAANPNVIVALGNTATWALLGTPEITRMRGTIYQSGLPGLTPRKVLPTFHPAAVARQWNMRPIACMDFEKANVEAKSPDVSYDNAELWLKPTLNDLPLFDPYMAASTLLSIDVETRRGMITEVGFAPSPDRAMTIPFRLKGPRPHYWQSAYEERMAWRWVRRWCESPIPKVMQNGMYDVQYFMRHGIFVRNFEEDTMLAHHSAYPELPKDLGFLGSVYTNHPSWKFLAGRHQDDLKKDA